eukprot:m.486050 g.486050  ORF g.486050 m.486050 type:complete len:51 (-) comp76315_c0_seq1:254-406(-)
MSDTIPMRVTLQAELGAALGDQAKQHASIEATPPGAPTRAWSTATRSKKG